MFRPSFLKIPCQPHIALCPSIIGFHCGLVHHPVLVTLQVPVSTPKVSLRSETGLLSIKLRIWKEKIRMVSAIKETDSRFLARQVYEEQKRNDWPGLAKEVEKICEIVGLPNANTRIFIGCPVLHTHQQKNTPLWELILYAIV